MDSHEHAAGDNGSAQCVRQPTCPACGGVFVPQRDGYRCTRCHFTLCVGCEPEDRPDPGRGRSE